MTDAPENLKNRQFLDTQDRTKIDFHYHGEERFDDSFKGYVDGIEYKFVSGDYLNFKPELILI